MLYLVWYLVAGVVAVIGTVFYGMVILPYACGYELEDWMDYFMECLDTDQSKLENCIGVALTVFLWPLKITWLLCDAIPEMSNNYEAQFEED